MVVGELLTIIYVRVSTRVQTEASQLEELEAWLRGQQCTVTWLRDQFTGKTMQRPGWEEVMRLVRLGLVARIIVWRIDRLGRTAREMLCVFAELEERKVALVSIRENLDLSTPAGRLMASIIASMAQWETEIRAERVAAGQAAARKVGKRWGGSKPGRVFRVTPELRAEVLEMASKGRTVAGISRMLRLSRPTIYNVLRQGGKLPCKKRGRRKLH